ncbi:MAG: tetratricopeptide repeat protein [Gemmatimonadetes bacterium]|nr:tetratricopeptide repeat protein [Gemmatimonadota bacterium]
MSGGLILGLGFVLVAAGALLWSFLGGRRGAKTKTPPYLLALAALADGDEEMAVSELKNTVREDSSNVDAYLRLGDLFRRRGDAERAFQLHRELASRPGMPKPQLARIQLALGHDHAALDRPQKALEAFRESARLAPDPGEALRQLLALQERLLDFNAAFETKKEILRRTNRLKSDARELAEYRAAQAESLLEDGDLKTAEKILREARKIDGESPSVRRTWGHLRERMGDYPGAIESWEAILGATRIVDETLFADLERVRFLDGSFSDMEASYQDFLEKSPGHEAASFGLARFLRRKGQIDDALGVTQAGLGQHPGSPALRTLQLVLLLQAGRTAEAETVLNDRLAQELGEAPRKTQSAELPEITS